MWENFIPVYWLKKKKFFCCSESPYFRYKMCNTDNGIVYEQLLCASFSDPYFNSIKEKLKKNGKILKNELKILLHLCQTSADVELARKVIYRYF